MKLTTETQITQTLYDGIVKAVERGYYESFRVINKEMTTPDGKSIYNPSDITISSLYICHTNPGDSSVLYLIKTADGLKGTLIHNKGSHSDSISNFIQEVNSINQACGEKRKFWYNFVGK
ncbi:hypothetical protein BH09BAC3_BH09BAC3_06060 [soil metagenome]